MTAVRRGRRLNSGQTMVEFIILIPVLLLLVLGAMQVALIYQAKSTLNYAAFLGARQGALKNASLTSIKDGVAAGMTPLFMRTSSAPDLGDLAKARLVSTIEVFNPLTAKVEIISPTKAAFTALAGGGTEIPNDNLMYRSGDGDGMSIQDANLLKIRVTYCVKLVVPFANRVIYSLVNGIEGMKNLANEFFWTPTTPPAPAMRNMCSGLSEMYAQLRQEVSSLTSSMPAGASIVDDLANDVINQIPSAFTSLSTTSIPGLGWNIGGMRIPVTAEAIVRMQSPVKDTHLP